MESILKTIKKLLGISQDQTYFDTDIIMHINSVFSVLTQLGVGPKEGFIITDENIGWEEFLSDNKNLELVKTYVYLKVRLLFDPPSSSAVMSSMERTISEYEWRLNVLAESQPSNTEDNEKDEQ